MFPQTLLVVVRFEHPEESAGSAWSVTMSYAGAQSVNNNDIIIVIIVVIAGAGENPSHGKTRLYVNATTAASRRCAARCHWTRGAQETAAESRFFRSSGVSSNITIIARERTK